MSAFSTSAQRSSSLDVSGIFPPIVTPFEANEEVSYGKLTENFSKWNDIPFRGKIYLFQESELLAIDSLFLQLQRQILFIPVSRGELGVGGGVDWRREVYGGREKKRREAGSL